jgi:hypothetical protein
MKVIACKSVMVGDKTELRDYKELEGIVCGSDQPFGPDYEFLTFTIAFDVVTLCYRHKEAADDEPADLVNWKGARYEDATLARGQQP